MGISGVARTDVPKSTGGRGLSKAGGVVATRVACDLATAAVLSGVENYTMESFPLGTIVASQVANSVCETITFAQLMKGATLGVAIAIEWGYIAPANIVARYSQFKEQQAARAAASSGSYHLVDFRDFGGQPARERGGEYHLLDHNFDGSGRSSGSDGPGFGFADRFDRETRDGMDSLAKEMRDLGSARDHGNDSSDDSSSDGDNDSSGDGGDGGDGGCFVTTACVEMQGMPDDCREMKRMRELRQYILGTRTGLQEIAEYNSTGPALVRSIKSDPCCGDIWVRAFVWITIAADLVEVGNFASARGAYYSLIRFLERLVADGRQRYSVGERPFSLLGKS